jgi:DNA-binding transcriptional ArsR family regulator
MVETHAGAAQYAGHRGGTIEAGCMNKKSAAAAALAALADPTRRQLIERLKAGPKAVGDLARGVPVSRPAVSQHLAVLKAAGLVRDVADGTRRVYEIDPKGLGAIRAWLDDMWGDALGRFGAELEKEP